jgi:hypothetical protein
MSKIKAKKLTLQYSYLILEKEEVDEVCFEMEKEIRKIIKLKYPKEYEEIFGSKNPKQNLKKPPPQEYPDEVSENIEEVSENIEVQKSIKNKDVKKLYRKIAEKTHPDKTGNNDRAEMFSNATKAYEQNNVGTLLNLAGALNIELTSLSPETVKLLENNIVLLSQEINTLKNTAAWAFHSADSDEQKEKVILTVINHLRSNKQ